MNSIVGLLLVAFAQVSCATENNTSNLFKEQGRFKFSGSEGWDYLTISAESRKLYLARSNRIMVVDVDSKKLLGEVLGLDGAHGIALDNNANHGFATSGKSNEVIVFDLKTLQILQKIKTGNKPDAIVYDPFSKKVFVFNGDGKSMTVINSVSLKVSSTVPLGGKPEFAATDAKGKIFVNLEDKNELVRIHAKSEKIEATFPLKPCEDPSGLAIDASHETLIVGCGNELAAVVDGNTGTVTQTFPVGSGVDASAFDEIHQRAFISAGSGTLTILDKENQKFVLTQNLQTSVGARTLAVDKKTGNVYLPSAKFKPLTVGSKNSHGRALIPDSFELILDSPTLP